MQTNTTVVQTFYDALAAGELAKALSCLDENIEWVTMWDYRANGRGPDAVAEGVLKPFVTDWEQAALVPDRFVAQDESVISLGHFDLVHAQTGKRAVGRYAHAWTVKDGRIVRFEQFIDTLAVKNASH
ncbi:MAG TPA: nuclear transport factor 2 family protein [Paraburkholderia sp.]|uniref:nuclear transport factor 2 family protein n=1 Tax=Paraburkholderia sp. TaxID=1926495 RepID=UPI002ED36F92